MLGYSSEVHRYVKIASDGSSPDPLGGGDMLGEEIFDNSEWKGRSAGVAHSGSFGWSREQCMDRRAVAQVQTLVSVSTATSLHINGRRVRPEPEPEPS